VTGGIKAALSLICGSVELGKNCKSCGSWRSSSLARARVRSLRSPIHLMCYCRHYYCCTSSVFASCTCNYTVSQFALANSDWSAPDQRYSSCLTGKARCSRQRRIIHISSIFQTCSRTVFANETLRIGRRPFRQTNLDGNHDTPLLMPGCTSTQAVGMRSSSVSVSQWRIYQVQHTQQIGAAHRKRGSL
jgi:hypothetical protein